MADPTRRMIVKGLPIVAGAGMFLNNGGNEVEAIEPNQPIAPAPSKKKVIPGSSPNLSRAIGFDRILFVSGVLGVEPDSRKLASAEFEGQCRQALTNLKASVEAGGASLSQVLKCTCFLVEAAV